MKSSFAIPALALLVAAIAGGFRLAELGSRPMHADESVQAAIFRGLWLQGEYAYNPDEFHGPALPYATLPSAWLGGAKSFAETTEATYRIVPALFGIGVVLLLWCFSDAIGRPAAFGASLLAAVSPVMVYYSRYYVHETLLVFFTLAAILAFWRYVRSGKLAWCLAVGAAVGLMQATKETAPLSYFAAVLGLGFAWLYGFGRDKEPAQDRPRLPWWHWGLAIAAALLVAVVLYSSFFTNPRGPIDAVLTYEPWLKRAAGNTQHANPWYFFLERLGWWRLDDGPLYSELLVLLLAALGFVTALFRKGRLLRDADIHFLRWLGFYTVVLTVVSSVIPYKTPWCVLQLLPGMLLLAGVGAVVLVRVVPTLPFKTVVALALIAGVGQLGWQSYRASFVKAADPENPWVFAHTSPDVLRLEGIVEEFAQAHPDGHALTVKIIWPDHYYWPLPWYLRRFDRVEPWTGLPPDPSAPIVIASPKFDKQLTAALEQTHLMTGYYEIRPQILAQLWVREDVWMAYLRMLGRI